MLRRSRDHLESVGESWVEHLLFAAAVARLMIAAGFACLAHAFVPALFPTTASRAIRRLHAALEDRSALRDPDGEGEGRPPLVALTLMSASAAALPWWAGAQPVFAVPLALLALAFPLVCFWAERSA